MFERTQEEMTATVSVDDKAAKAWNENGLTFARGPRTMTYAEAVAMVTTMQRLLRSVPKYQYKRCRAMMNSMRNACGPECGERQP